MSAAAQMGRACPPRLGLTYWMIKPEIGPQQSVFVPFVSEGVYHPRKGTRRYLAGKQNHHLSAFKFPS